MYQHGHHTGRIVAVNQDVVAACNVIKKKPCVTQGANHLPSFEDRQS